MEDELLISLFDSLKAEMHQGFAEMGIRFEEVNHRLDRIDTTLVNHGRQLGAGARSIAAFAASAVKADADYVQVLAELSDLKTRIMRLEAK